MATNLCCGGSLQTGSRIIGMLQATEAFIILILCTINIIRLQQEFSTMDENEYEFSDVAKLLIATAFLFRIISFFFGVFLYVVASYRNIRHCQIWVYAYVLLAPFYILMFIVAIVDLNFKDAGIFVVSLLILVYCIGVVHSFTKELQGSRDRPQPIL